MKCEHAPDGASCYYCAIQQIIDSVVYSTPGGHRFTLSSKNGIYSLPFDQVDYSNLSGIQFDGIGTEERIKRLVARMRGSTPGVPPASTGSDWTEPEPDDDDVHGEPLEEDEPEADEDEFKWLIKCYTCGRGPCAHINDIPTCRRCDRRPR